MYLTVVKCLETTCVVNWRYINKLKLKIEIEFDGGPKLIQEREQSKTQPGTENRHTKSQSHIPTLMRTHKNTHTHAPNVKTNKNGRCTLAHTPHTYSILPGPGPNSPWGQPALGPRR
ncbi:hypothetical protein ILYODFUR_038411 [Ilyodon furcidens]|uniref:Uncharacterized protein n=1 Tax=Ilyodon furcidens TaxID=33524 RepID=A0ABV0UMI1_9TELE